MSEFKQKTTCTYCGEKNAVTVTTKQTKFSRSVKISRCEKCKRQNGVKAIINQTFIDA